MSSSNRTTTKGGKGSKTDNKSHKSETGKGSDKQHGRDNTHSKSEDSDIKEKVRQLIETSQRSEEEVCLALHECSYDVNSAMIMLLEELGEGEWETSVKKKKNRQASASKQDKPDDATAGSGNGGNAEDDWDNLQTGNGAPTSGAPNEKDKQGRNKGGPPRLHGRHNDSRGWRGREKQENERNLEEGGGGRSDYHRDRRGRPGGSTRGGGGGRGRGGGRTGGGRFGPRGGRGGGYNKPIDTWDNNTVANTTNHSENWDTYPVADEWNTEEYTGSLADTKVFTPTTAPTIDEVVNSATGDSITIDNAVINSQPPPQSPVQIGGTLNAAQTQYFSQLTQQNSDNIKQYGAAQTYHATQNATYGGTPQTQTQSYGNNQYGASGNAYVNSGYQGTTGNNNYGNGEQTQQQPVRTKTQRARVPPPSKIPSSAVEMPGELNSSIGYLDVQFGAMDFMSDSNSFDNVTDNKYGSTNSSSLDNSTVPTTGNLDLNATNQNSTLDAYSPKSNVQSSISSALTQSLTDTIPQTSEHLTNAYNTAPRSTTGSTATSTGPSSSLDLGKQGDTHSYSQQTSYNSYQQKSNYNVTTYSGSQTSNTYVSNQANSNYANSQSTPYNAAYQNAYSSAASYQSNTNASGFPSISQANSYPSNNYQQNSIQSVYGANTGSNSSSATSQFNSYSSASTHKLGKDTSYDNSSSAVSNTQTTSSNVTSTTALSLSQSTVSVTKSTTTLAAKNSSSVVSNIPPGVGAPVMSTPYIMGQVPYFQPPVYSYEEVQMIQQRMPHLTTPYYDMSYQTPTTLAAVRDGGLSNVGYSISSDGRYTRSDSNASPVPSTMSQTSTTGHQAQPILASPGHPYYFTPLNSFPNFQHFGMYAQLPTVTNAHGSSNSTQYPKPTTYGSGYGSYDTLSQTQDYNKTGYVSNNQGQKSGAVNATSTGGSGNDLTAMYGKSHAALGKVNSYDKQGFHSGTPPPAFTAALHAGQNAGMAPSGTAGTYYIPAAMTHQPQLSTHMMQQPLGHQMDVRHQGRRVDSGNNSGNRSQNSNQAKGGAKQTYPNYWNQP